MNDNIEKVREFAIKHTRIGEESIHGIDHWDRVAKNGEALHVPDADMEVLLCFAYLHDVERQTDAYDVEHGPKAAELIDQIRDSVLSFLDDKQIGLLKDACTFHTTVPRTGNPTIDTCFDADRLDLPRAYIIPDPEKMATKEGAEKAKEMKLSDRVIRSIEDVTNPLLNSINEKCSRIKSVFASEVEETLLCNYIIIGKSGEEKKISLPRNLVIWEK